MTYKNNRSSLLNHQQTIRGTARSSLITPIQKNLSSEENIKKVTNFYKFTESMIYNHEKQKEYCFKVIEQLTELITREKKHHLYNSYEIFKVIQEM